MRRYYVKNLRTIVVYVRYVLDNKTENYTTLPRNRPWRTRVHHTPFTLRVLQVWYCAPGGSVLTRGINQRINIGRIAELEKFYYRIVNVFNSNKSLQKKKKKHLIIILCS
jgi:hypothetical protein